VNSRREHVRRAGCSGAPAGLRLRHAGFWLVKESFGMHLTRAAKTQTVVQTLVSVLGLCMALLLSVFA